MPILTIAIPTYNRSLFLKKCLDNILQEVNTDYADKVSILVSDNASTDDTKEIVAKYSGIKYYRNEENLGFDGNFINCYLKSDSKYVWIFGDDDLLLPGYLGKIIGLLENGNYGVVHIESQSFEEEKDIILPDKILDVEDLLSGIEFVDRVNYFLTFISSNIFNKDAIKNEIVINPHSRTNLIQIEWYTIAILKVNQNAIIRNKIIACKADNTGGYKLVTTFSKNYNSILKSLVKRGYDRRIVRLTNQKLISSFFPQHLNKILFSQSTFAKESGFFISFKEYWSYKYYWIFIFPIYTKFFFKRITSNEKKL